MRNITKVFIIGLIMFFSYSHSSFAENIEDITQPIIEVKASIKKESKGQPKALYKRVFVVKSKKTEFSKYKFCTGSATFNKARSETFSTVTLKKTQKVKSTSNIKGTYEKQLTDKDKLVIEATLGSDWEKKYSVKTEKKLKIPSKKWGWFEYKVKYEVRKGYIYSYYEDRTTKKPVTIKTPVDIRFRSRTAKKEPK